MSVDSDLGKIKVKHLTDLEKILYIQIIKLGGTNVIPFVSDSGRNILLASFRETSELLEFRVAWGIMHDDVNKLLDSERDKIDMLGALSVVDPRRLKGLCLARYLMSAIAGMSPTSCLRWSLEVGDLVNIFRMWLSRLDIILSIFNDAMVKFKVELGEHIKCVDGRMEYKNGEISYRLISEDLAPRGQIMFRHKKTSIGIGFSESLFDWVWWYQIHGLANPLEDYIRSIIVNGDM
jgi:hypothetical protein